jgi:hypothetical protein
MIYSVWDSKSKTYHYYDGPDTNINPKHLGFNSTQVGVSADKAQWKLPKGSIHVGQGPQARGMLATMGDVSIVESPLVFLGGSIVVYIMWKLLDHHLGF